MQAYAETIFDAAYLTFVTVIGLIMLRQNYGRRQYKLFGVMAIVLGCGDAFHLIPRAVALMTVGLEAFTVPLGIGKLITSVTMTVFYIILYYIWRLRYHIIGADKLTAAMYALAAARVALCALPQNGWLTADPPLLWGVIRNIPFLAIGIIIMVLFYKSSRGHNDRAFYNLWLAVFFSFLFYLPVVLLSSRFPIVGALMVPKTLCYVWTVMIGFSAMRLGEEPYDEPRFFSKPSANVLKIRK